MILPLCLCRPTSRSLGLVVFIVAFAALLIFFGQVRHAYDQHKKFKRLEGYKQYVEDVANYMDKVETTANRSNISMARLYSLLKKPFVLNNQEAGDSVNLKDDTSKSNVLR